MGPARTSLLARLRRHDDGSVMLEALVAAVVLLVIALALLAGMDTAATSSAKTKARSVAAGIAEQELERLRSIPVTQLSNFHDDHDVPAGGATYHVASRADWIRDASGTTQSCTSDSTQAQYLRITSTVTSGIVGKRMAPVSESSLVSPPVAAFGANQGTLAVHVVDRDGKDVVNATVRATAASGGGTLADATNTAGCAVFGYIAAGTYDIAVSAPNYVDPAGNPTATEGGYVVQAGQVNLTELKYDLAGSVTFGFSSADPVNGQVNPSRGWSAVISDGSAPRAVSGAAAPTVSPAASIGPTQVFPNMGAYTFFAGDCSGNDPTKAPASIANFFSTVAPGQTQKVDRGKPVSVTLNQPSFKAKVVSANPATISVKQTTSTPTATTPACTANLKMGPAGTWTTFPAVDGATYVTKAWSLAQTPKYADTGLPFGTYQLCALDPAKKKYATASVSLTSLTAPAVATLDTTAATATTGTACP
jgi:Tfp pilus assembly protein PilV